MHQPLNDRPDGFQAHGPVKNPIHPHFAGNSLPENMVLVDPSKHSITSEVTRKTLLDKGPTTQILENHKLLDIAMLT